MSFINKKGLNLATFFFLKDRKISVEKAYVEGIYADTPANRKLGRVGMSYADYNRKIMSQQEDTSHEIENMTVSRVQTVCKEACKKNLGVKDKGEFFSITFEDQDFTKENIQKVKADLELRGAKVFVSENTKSMRAYKKDTDMKEVIEDTYKIGDYTFDTVRQQLVIGDNKVDLTSKESQLLEVFISHPNKMIEKDFILEKIWKESNYFNSRSMDVYVTKLRQKLADAGVEIITVYGKGFKFVLPKSEEPAKEEIKKEEVKEQPKKEEPKEKSWGGASSASQSEVFKKINQHFGFDDEDGEWFMDTPIAMSMSDDKEFGEIIDKFTNYEIKDQTGSYENNGNRKNMMECNVEYYVYPKYTPEEDIDDSIKKVMIGHKTTIRDLVNELGTNYD